MDYSHYDSSAQLRNRNARGRQSSNTKSTSLLLSVHIDANDKHSFVDEPQQKQKLRGRTANAATSSAAAQAEDVSDIERLLATPVMRLVALLVGLAIMWTTARAYATYTHTLHENNLWFSNIKEVEREISFRTESGLYYSYYKQMTSAVSVRAGLSALMHDNNTECWRTVNILERFNIYQEVLLASLYRVFGQSQKTDGRIFFYIDSVFALHGVYVAALYLLTWQVSGSFLTALLALAFFVVNRENATRVEFTTPLRESFAIPFIFIQLLLVSVYLSYETANQSASLRGHYSYKKKCLVAGIFACTLAFCLFWQFSQFVLMLESFALVGIHLLGIVNARTTRRLLLVYLTALLSTFVFQFGNKMIMSSLGLHFIWISIVTIRIEERWQLRWRACGTSLLLDFAFSVCHGGLVLAAAIVTGAFVKKWLDIEADNHIYKFVLNKLNLQATLESDFETRLYLCHGGFEYLPWSTLRQLSSTLLLPVYACGQLVFIAQAVVRPWYKSVRSRLPPDSVVGLVGRGAGRPIHTDSEGKMDGIFVSISPTHKHHAVDKTTTTNIAADIDFNRSPQGQELQHQQVSLAYLTVQTFFFFILAASTSRMKYLWTPAMCALAATLVSSAALYKRLFHSPTVRLIMRHAVTLAFILLLFYQNESRIKSELEELREFYDPDTVQLMEWINGNTRPDASFTGSMQLLAGVKCCTSRPLTNHPHFEDRQLRDATKELYQVYAMQPADVVHGLLRKYKADYVILEDSICLSGPKPNYCSLKELLDIDNKHLIPPGNADKPVLPTARRFCNEIRYNGTAYLKYFKLVMKNPTFRVYKLLD